MSETKILEQLRLFFDDAVHLSSYLDTFVEAVPGQILGLRGSKEPALLLGVKASAV